MVASVSGSVLEQGYVVNSPNGTEEGQSKAVVIVTESVNDIIHRAEGSFFNTIPENPQGTSDTVNIVFTFNEAVDMSIVELKYFNPFVIKNMNRGVEIHMPNMEPTNLADLSLLGTYDDASNPSAGIFYVTTSNLPWGMFLVEPFDYPVEKTQIIDAYTHFGAWAESGGTVYNDWYKSFSGYRNQAVIY
jgi:LruC domain-containing protein